MKNQIILKTRFSNWFRQVDNICLFDNYVFVEGKGYVTSTDTFSKITHNGVPLLCFVCSSDRIYRNVEQVGIFSSRITAACFDHEMDLSKTFYWIRDGKNV